MILAEFNMFLGKSNIEAKSVNLNLRTAKKNKY